jgi:DNA end-binding protein Ku
MEQTDHAALGRFVMRAKEYLTIVRARDGALALTTMRFHDEVRPTKDVPNASGKSTKPAKRELDAAVALIEALATEWNPERYEDEYRKRLQKIVNKKRKGQTIEVPDGAGDEPDAVPALMAALQQALEEAKKGGERKRSSSSKKARASA